MILTSQLVTLTTEDGTVIELLNLDHPGHKTQEPDVENCHFGFDTPDGRIDIALTGFYRPQATRRCAHGCAVERDRIKGPLLRRGSLFNQLARVVWQCSPPGC